jgi:hypothetical protein
MAGISGPCPLCSAYVTSPPAEKQVKSQPPRKEAAPPADADNPRIWLQPHLVENEEARRTARPRRTGLYVTAGIILFAGGVAGALKMWAPPEPEKKAAAVAPEPLRPRPAVRPEILAADEPPGVIPAPSPGPAGRLPAAPTAIARNLSGAPLPAVPVTATPAPAAKPVASPPDAGPEVKSPPPEPAKPELKPGEMSEAEKEIRKIVPVTGHLSKPGTALIRFLAAPKWQERLRYSLAPEKVKPLMEAYYKTWPDGPVIPEDIKLTRIEPTEEDPNRKYYAFLLFLPDKEAGIPVSIEETKNGCLVEWCSFVESKDQVLAKFFDGWRKEPGTFRVMARRSHYFSDDVPDQKKKECLGISAPDATGPFTVWLDKDNPDFGRYFAKGDRQRWDVSSPLVITCQWEKTEKGAQYVRVRDVVVDTWHPDLLPDASKK